MDPADRMPDIDDTIVQEAAERGESFVIDDFVRLVEQFHPDGKPGVSRGVLDAYARAVEDERPKFDAAAVSRAIDDRVSEDGEYAPDAFYRLDDERISVYPPAWHDDLGGETDLREYVRYLSDRDHGAENGTELGGIGPGVPEQELIDIVGILGNTDPRAAKNELESLRDDGELVEDADQHPNARVRLSDRADNARDSSLDP